MSAIINTDKSTWATFLLGNSYQSKPNVRSMALVHEKLYQSSDLSRINMSEYVNSLGSLLMRSFGVEPDKIRFEVKETDVLLSIEAAVPCGLILNELISNCLKHAFTGRALGTIRAGIERIDTKDIRLVVRDDGKGLPAEMDPKRVESLGLRLVHTLTDQLDGRIEIHNDQGTEIAIVFAEPEKLTK